MQRVLVGNGKTITTKKKFIRLLRLQTTEDAVFFLAIFTSGYGVGKGTSPELCGRRSQLQERRIIMEKKFFP